MDRERDEVFERIPWETLEQAPKDNNKLVIYLAGAVVVGSLAFALVRDRPPSPVPLPPVTEVPATTETLPHSPSPSLLAEADLYAVDHDRLASDAAAHAEWFAVEYLSSDGSEASRAILQSLLPQGVPLPSGPEEVKVAVDWVGAVSVSESGPLSFEVEVMVRTTAVTGGDVPVRQPPRTMVIEVGFGHDGQPRVLRPPLLATFQMPAPHLLGLVPVSEHLREHLSLTYAEVVGGEPLPDGRWMVVVMAVDPDGVTRPRSVLVP